MNFDSSVQLRSQTFNASVIATVVLTLFLAFADGVIYIYCYTGYQPPQNARVLMGGSLLITLIYMLWIVIWLSLEIQVTVILGELTEWDIEAAQWKLKRD